ncbi:MAG: hypothetical protein E7309_05010 [Butyrivibrio sp.]|jgi:serine/threonine protein kinase|nr:hypothetical protein [Butyrivibrio sp.]
MPNPNYKNIDGIMKVKINNDWIEPKFDRYEDLKPIGEPGANGVVICGKHKVLKRTEAIKIWLPRQVGNTSMIRKDQYLSEVQKVAALNDPHFPSVHDAWTENGCLCSSMELIDGCTYNAWLKRNLNMRKRIHMLTEIFDAIVIYQSKGIIHGDVHANNIMIDTDEHVHIIDFGTSVFSRYPNQSVHRENFLMYELVEQTIASDFNPEAFTVRKYNVIHGNPSHEDDIKNAIPLLWAKTVQCYLKLITLLNDVSDITSEPELIYEYCNTIASGLYLNIDFFVKQVFKEKEPSTIQLTRFGSCLYECFEDYEYAECQDSIPLADKLEFLSLYVYYNALKSDLKEGTIGIDEIKTELMELGKVCNYDKAVPNFINSNDLFAFHTCLMSDNNNDWPTVYAIECSLRESLFRVYEKHYEDGELMYQIQRFNLNIETLKLNPVLCEDILRLSYIYVANNG